MDVALDQAQAAGVSATRKLLADFHLKPACIGFPHLPGSLSCRGRHTGAVARAFSSRVHPIHLRKLSPEPFIYRMDEMLRFAKDCGPNIGLLVGSWHWRHAGATTNAIVRADRDRIVYVQITIQRILLLKMFATMSG